MTGTKLTPKQFAFVHEYVKDKNATQAAIRAGYAQKTAEQGAAQLLGNIKIKAEVDRLLLSAAEKSKLTLEEAVADVARALRFDPRNLYNDDGSMKSIKDLDYDTASCITGIEVVAMKAEDGSDTPLFVKKIKWDSKTSARDQALRMFGAFEKDNKQKASALDGLPREVLQMMAERLRALNAN